MVEGRHCLGADRVTQIIKFLRLDAEGQDIPTIDKMVKSYLRSLCHPRRHRLAQREDRLLLLPLKTCPNADFARHRPSSRAN